MHTRMLVSAGAAGIGSGLHTQSNLIFSIGLESGPKASEERKTEPWDRAVFLPVWLFSLYSVLTQCYSAQCMERIKKEKALFNENLTTTIKTVVG